jgi:large subunit ribosomal protein L31
VIRPAFITRTEDRTMREGIHPEYKKATVTCVCGNHFETRSTMGNLKIEICSACHPFFTGRQKLVDSAGRVERYNRKYAKKTQETPAA